MHLTDSTLNTNSAVVGGAILNAGAMLSISSSTISGNSASTTGGAGEVEVRSTATGPVTTVFVRQLGSDNSWWVLGAATADINLSEPVWFASISSPVALKGTSSAYEGTVSTQVREDDNGKPLGEGYVTGGSMGMGPFDGSLVFTKPTKKYGALMLFTQSQEGTDTGHTREVGVLRIRFSS